MELNSLTAISPIDGRYRDKVGDLDIYFSEFGLIRYRVLVEIEYFISLCSIPLPELKSLDKGIFEKLRNIYIDFSADDAAEIKAIEQTTNHDVKAVEYFIKKQFDNLGLEEYKEFIHFGLTSQDINNTAVPLSLKEAMEFVYYPIVEKAVSKLKDAAEEWKDIPMLAHTHGQPASPTKLGKEIMVFVERLEIQLSGLKQIPYSAKFGGATGNFNAHKAAYPDIDWIAFGNNFANKTLRLSRSQTTTQIEHYDNFAAFCHACMRTNTILIDLCRDVWTYISMEYFGQKVSKHEVGSSAMPHKVNPIDFENAEGNLGFANAVFSHLASKLPVSRLQRDLTDSTVLRNIGIPLAHSLLALKSLLKGLNKIYANEKNIASTLENNWAVVSEAIQTILRKINYPNPYEALKDLTRGEKITKEVIHDFIEKLNVDETIKKQMKSITPMNYTGVY